MSDDPAVGVEPEGEGKGPIPYERFQATVAERNALRTEIKALRDKAGLVEAAQKEAADAKGALAAALAEHADAIALHRSGISDDEGQVVARTLYGRLPAEGKPATISDWLSGLKADGAAVPKALQPYLVTPAAPAAALSPPAPKPAGTNGSTPPAGGRVDNATIRAAREEWHRTGNPAKLKQLLGVQ